MIFSIAVLTFIKLYNTNSTAIQIRTDRETWCISVGITFPSAYKFVYNFEFGKYCI